MLPLDTMDLEDSILLGLAPYFCSGCDLAILDDQVHFAGSSFWHKSCMLCCKCQCALVTSCHISDGRLFCDKHYLKFCASSCPSCDRRFSPNDSTYQIRDSLYHVTCAKCYVCRNDITSGQHFKMLSGKIFICSTCTEKCSTKSSHKTKSLTTIQRLTLKGCYDTITSRPDKQQLKYLSEELDLNIKTIKLWFQTQRSLERRIKSKGTVHYLPSDPSNQEMSRDHVTCHTSSGMDCMACVYDDMPSSSSDSSNQGTL